MKIERTPKFNYLTCVKTQYEHHLIELLKEPFYMKYKELCDLTIKSTKSKNKMLKNFQEQLKNTNEWDYETLKIHAKYIVHKSNCKYLPKLIKSTIISSTKNLIETSSRKKINIEYEIPDTMTFLKKCFNFISKAFYLEPTLICDLDQKPGLRLKNINNSLELIRRAIKKALNSFLPYDEILDIYLNNVDDDSDNDSVNDSSDDEQEEDIDDDEVSEHQLNEEEEEDNDIKGSEMTEENMKKEIIEEITDEAFNNLPNDDAHSIIDEIQQPIQQPIQQQPIQQQSIESIQEPPMNYQQQPIQQNLISHDKDIPDEFNFIPMKAAPLPPVTTKNLNQIKQVPLRPTPHGSTQEDINFLRNLN